MTTELATEPGIELGTALPVRRRFPARAALASVLAAGAASVLLDSVSSRFVPGNSDGATVILEGQAISRGDLGLHGWSLSLDSFWSLDALANAIVVGLSGLRPNVLNLVPAIIAALVVVVGAWMAADGRRGAAAAAGVGVVTLMLALPSPGLSFFLLQGPWHVGTALCCLLAFAALSDGRAAWRWLVAVLLLGLAINGDVMALLFGVAPVLAAGVAAVLRCRRLRAGAGLLLAAVASVPVALGIRAIAQVLGTFVIVNRNLPVRLSQVAHNVTLLPNRVAGLFGIGTIPSVPGNRPVAFEVFRVGGLLVVGAGALAALASLCAGSLLGRTGWAKGRADLRGSWRLDDLLVFACAADVVTFLFGAASDNPQYAKYLTPGVIFAVILAARYAARLVDHLGATTTVPASKQPAAAGPARRSGALIAGAAPAKLALGAVGLTLGVAYALQVGTFFSHATAPQSAQELGSFLASRDLTLGIGDYWSSSIVTVETSGAVVIRPVTTSPQGTLRRYERQSAVSWYQGKRFQFFVYDLARPWRNVNDLAATRTYGPPAGVYPVGPYRVLVWSHPVTVSTAVPTYGSPLQIFWSPPGGPRTSSTTTSTTTAAAVPARGAATATTAPGGTPGTSG